MKMILQAIGYVLIGATLTYYILQSDRFPMRSDSESSRASTEKIPLYWVAPMDANYRRDKPGKSPMGMDLVPVFTRDNEPGPGMVLINPVVEHNLGLKTTRVAMGTLKNQIRTVGYVNYNQDHLVHIHPRVEGWVEKLHVKSEGEPVKAGQLLYELYSPELVNAQEELLLSLQRGSDSLIKGSRQKLQALQFQDAFVDNLIKTRQVRNRVSFYAPQSGVVASLEIREGFFVQPGTTMMSIGGLDSVWVEAEVFERESDQVQAGDRVSMTLDYLPGRTWESKVDYVYPTLDPVTRTLRVRTEFQNNDGVLKPNMFVGIVISNTSPSPALLVPAESVIRTGQSNRVVVALGQGRYHSVPVTIGRRDANQIEIISGLNESDIVVTSAQFLLDSESSKTTDIGRMESGTHGESGSPMDDSLFPDLSLHQSNPDNTATVEGRVTALDLPLNQITIDRGPIEVWGRPAATVNFSAANETILRQLNAGKQIHFTFSVTDSGDFVIIGINKGQNQSEGDSND